MALDLDIAFHGDPSVLAAFAREVEQRDTARGLFVAETQHDPFVSLALAAVRTERLQLGTSVALAFARSPMQMAYSAYDLQRLSRGRLILGLGSQIKPHIVRRYSMPWSRPAARMQEYIGALRAIFDSWQTGERLKFRGQFYSHTLMPPLFDPGPLDGPSPEIWLAGVGPLMVRTAGRVADGFMAHPLLSRSYLERALLPEIAAGRALRESEPFTVSLMTMVATGRTEEQLAEAIAGTRRQIGFYASTPAYKPVLDHHGWGALHDEAHVLSTTNRWSELEALVDDEVLHTLAVVGELETVGAELRQRFEGLADRITLSMPYDADSTLALDVISSS